MLTTGKPVTKAREVPVLEDGVEIARLRAVPDHREWLTFAVDDRSWSVECTWSGGYRSGTVLCRPEDVPDGAVPMRASYAGLKVRSVVLGERALVVDSASFLRGSHRYSHGGRVLAETGATGFFRVRTTLVADSAVRRPEAVFLLSLDLYTCRRNTGAAGALRFHVVPTESYV